MDGDRLPAEFYALGVMGHGIPVRATITSFGPVLLSKALQFLESITQTVRLIRSKGVGVFFTPDDQKALRATVQTFPNSAYDLEEVLRERLDGGGRACGVCPARPVGAMG